MSGRLDVESLRALERVVALGGVTRAADALALTQPAVSHKIKRLEESIGRDLLLRRPGGPVLTDDGVRLLDYAARIIALHDEALSSLGRKGLSGHIRLGLTEDTTAIGLSRTLARFRRVYPNVTVEAQVRQSLTLSDWIDGNGLDLAVIQVLESQVRVSDHVLGTDDLVWVESLDFDLSASRPIPFVAFDEACFYRRWAFAQMDAGQLPGQLRTVLHCASIGGVLSAVRAGLGVALINRRYLDGTLRELKSGFPKPPPIAYVIRKPKTKPGSATEALAALISEEFC